MKKFILAIGFIGFLASCGSDATSTEENTTTSTSTEVSNDYKITFQWTAFKTPARVGVNGTFDKIDVISYNQDTETVEGKISNAAIKLQGTTVNTDDPGRDNTLRMFFFENLGNDGIITAEFGELKNGKAPVTLILGESESISKTFDYEVDGSEIKIGGKIDLIEDFKAQKAYDALHEECNSLHEGVTGTDVEINVSVRF